MSTRRAFILGLGAALAAPSIVRAESLMKIATLRSTIVGLDLGAADFTAGIMVWQVGWDDWKLMYGFISPEDFYAR